MAIANVTVVTYNTPLTANCVAFTCTSSQTGARVTNAQLVAGAGANGALASFFTPPVAYADSAAADAAFRNLLGTVVIRQTGGTASSTTTLVVTWDIVATQVTLLIQATTITDAVYEVLIRSAHTIMR